MLRAIWGASLYLCVLVDCALAQQPRVQLDSSDWWSYTRQEELPYHEPKQSIRFQNREPAQTNFRISGIVVDSNPHDFSGIRARLGEATEVGRGDAASGRNQICYVSASDSVHVVFEFGEINSAVYLFKDGPKWHGRELCAHSNEVSESSSMASGLKLGISPLQVKAILGDPSIVAPDRLIYYFGYKNKTNRQELARLRKDTPDTTDAEFIRNFEYADGEAYIEARFASGKLNYLAISKSETY